MAGEAGAVPGGHTTSTNPTTTALEAGAKQGGLLGATLCALMALPPLL